MALEDNLREKEQEMRDIEISYQNYKDEFEKVNRKTQDRSEELENLIMKQK
jgi:hypothetical protein